MASTYKRGRSWYLDWFDTDGRHKKSLGRISKDIADLKLKQLEYQLARGNGSEEKKTSIKFNELASEYLTWYENEYVSSYETADRIVMKSLSPYFFKQALDKITFKDVEAYKRTTLASGNVASTVNRKLSVLSGMITYAKKSGYLTPEFKITDIPELNSRPPKYYEKDQIESIYAHSIDRAHWWKFMVNTGIRMGEFYNLRCEDIKKDGIYIISTATGRTKSGKWRLIPMSNGIKKALKEFDLTQEYLIPRIKKQSVGQAFKRACKRAGIPPGKQGIHCLRHTFASYLVMDRVSLHTVQKLLGHAKMETTEKYAHLSPNYLKDTMAGVDF